MRLSSGRQRLDVDLTFHELDERRYRVVEKQCQGSAGGRAWASNVGVEKYVSPYTVMKAEE